MISQRAELHFDVTADDTIDTLQLRTELWDYLTKLIRAFNQDHIGIKPGLTARMPTATIDLKTVRTL